MSGCPRADIGGTARRALDMFCAFPGSVAGTGRTRA